VKIATAAPSIVASIPGSPRRISRRELGRAPRDPGLLVKGVLERRAELERRNHQIDTIPC